ncbi:MAG: hypothetical protein QOI88_2085 [Gammaproteobacteria bacterium]|nr:hypothetical protein [Gammaproteobacteria bacterium]
MATRWPRQGAPSTRQKAKGCSSHSSLVPSVSCSPPPAPAPRFSLRPQRPTPARAAQRPPRVSTADRRTKSTGEQRYASDHPLNLHAWATRYATDASSASIAAPAATFDARPGPEGMMQQVNTRASTSLKFSASWPLLPRRRLCRRQTPRRPMLLLLSIRRWRPSCTKIASTATDPGGPGQRCRCCHTTPRNRGPPPSSDRCLPGKCPHGRRMRIAA